MASKQLIPKADTFTLSFCTEVLQRMQDDLTQFSVVYDVNNLLFTVYLFHDFDHKAYFDLQQELKKGKRVMDLPTLFPAESRYHQVYIKRQSPQNNVLILLLLVISAMAFLYTLIVWPSARLMKNQEFAEKNLPRPNLDRVKLYSFVICILFSIYLIVLWNYREAFQIGLPPTLNNLPFILRMIIHIPILLCIMIIPLLFLNISALKQLRWTAFLRWQYTLNTVLYVLLLGLFFYWGFVIA